MRYVGAIDQGTTSTRFILFNEKGEAVATHQLEHRQYYPEPGYVEHDPEEIWNNTRTVIREAVRKSGVSVRDIKGLGITNPLRPGYRRGASQCDSLAGPEGQQYRRILQGPYFRRAPQGEDGSSLLTILFRFQDRLAHQERTPCEGAP